MQDTKANGYHINNNDEIKECHATKRKCRYGGIDGKQKHFTTIAEAEDYVKNKLISEGKIKDGVTRRQNKSNEIATELPVMDDSVDSYRGEKLVVDGLFSESTSDPLVLERVGAVVNDVVSRELGLDLNNPLSSEDLALVESKVREVFSSFVVNGGGLKNKLIGAHSGRLVDAVRILPDSVKDRFSDRSMIIGTSIARNHFGAFTLGMFSDNYRKQTYVDSKVNPESLQFSRVSTLSDSLEVGTVFGAKRFVAENFVDGNGSTLYRKDSDGFTEVYVGDFEGKTRQFKSIGVVESIVNPDGTVVSREGGFKLSVVREPKFEYFSRIDFKKSLIDSPDLDHILLHEYVHYIQSQDYLSRDTAMFDEIRGKYVSFNAGMMFYSEFPNSYMGMSTGKEFLTVATQSYFNPVRKNHLFGGSPETSDDLQAEIYRVKETNAERIRNWVVGYWLALDRESRDRLSN